MFILKKGAFIGKINSPIQEFYFADSQVLLKLVQSYACNIYGIWNLFAPVCQKSFMSYNFALRAILKLHRTTHRYVLENMTDIPHFYVELLSQYVTFIGSLLSSSFPVRFLSRFCVSDLRTVMG